jgi:ArsR family transcriptional regulator
VVRNLEHVLGFENGDNAVPSSSERISSADIVQSMSNYLSADETTAPSPDRLRSLSRSRQVLADPRRLLLLEMLVQGVQCNCDLGDALGMAPNLISHHMSVLREAGLVLAERDPLDARWVYYSVDPTALGELRDELGLFLDPSRIQPRRSTCGPRVAPIHMERQRS